MEEFFAWAVTGGTGVNGLKTESLDNEIQEFSLAKSSWYICNSLLIKSQHNVYAACRS